MRRRGQCLRRAGDHSRTIPAITFSSTGHTGADVPVYANWPDGLQGQTIDDTETFFLMEDTWKAAKRHRSPACGLGITETSATVQWNTIEPSDSQVVLSGNGGSLSTPCGWCLIPFCAPTYSQTHLHADGVV